jgi:zinc transport system ATP-binding protein
MMNALRLDICALTCRHGSVPAVQELDLHLAPGEHVALLGGNGSGKTTLLRAVIGLHRDWSGSILLDGQSLPRRPAAAHPGMAWMPQRQARGQFPFTVRELLAAGGHEQAALNAADELGISGLLRRPLAALSGGQLQRAYLAKTLGAAAVEAGLLLADEPTAALDFAGQEQVADMLAALPTTALVVTHDMALAEKCHRIFKMAQGKIREISFQKPSKETVP